jgi:Tol biopolymer transport system component
VINADGSGEPVQLTFNSLEERAPAWSPDGSKIAFMCRYGGTDFEICVMNPDGSGLVQVMDNTVQELSIRWSVDGQKFFFNSPVPGAQSAVFDQRGRHWPDAGDQHGRSQSVSGSRLVACQNRMRAVRLLGLV